MMERLYNWLATAPILHKAGIITVMCGAILGYYYFVPYSAAIKKVEKSEDKVNVARMTLSASKRKLRRNKAARKELLEIQKRGKNLNSRIPSSVDMSQLVGELDEMADEINIRKIKPVDEEQSLGTEVKIKPIQFELTGRFHPISRFLYKMFQMNRLMDVGDISLKLVHSGRKKISELEKPHKLEAKFIARIYYSPNVGDVEIDKKKK